LIDIDSVSLVFYCSQTGCGSSPLKQGTPCAKTNDFLGPDQYGFRKRCGARDAI